VRGDSEYKIAEDLNRDGIPSPSGRRWGAGGILARLRNEKYAGTMVYNQTSGKLKTPKHPNPPEQWVRTPEALLRTRTFRTFAFENSALSAPLIQPLVPKAATSESLCLDG